MAIIVNGNVLRNLPEQVSKNTEDILELQNASENYGIRITALEGDAIALATFQDCTFTGTTTFSGPLNSSGGFTFGDDGYVAGDLSVGGDFSIAGSVSGNLPISGDLSVSRTSTFMGTVTASGDENVGGDLAVAGSSSFTGNVNASGNLAVVGNITGGSIVENMSGYVFTKLSDIVWNDVYVGVVKNGNKLTVVVFGSYNKQAGDPVNPSICTISAPSAVMNKLVPFTIGSITNALDVKTVSFFSLANTSVSIPMRIVKSSNALYYIMSDTSGLTNGVDYLFRYEATFLLSDKLN